jgi:hypothetical protein
LDARHGKASTVHHHILWHVRQLLREVQEQGRARDDEQHEIGGL